MVSVVLCDELVLALVCDEVVVVVVSLVVLGAVSLRGAVVDSF